MRSMSSEYYQICKLLEKARKLAMKKAVQEHEREERRNLPEKTRARIAWTVEEIPALLTLPKRNGLQWVKIKSANVAVYESEPINVKWTRADLFDRYKCLMERKTRIEKAGYAKWTDKLDKKLLVLFAMQEQDWRTVADEIFIRYLPPRRHAPKTNTLLQQGNM